jgi:predicted peroxiredoxin
MSASLVRSLLVCLVVLVSLPVAADQGDEAIVRRDGVFIHISHGLDDPHRVLMALQMASIMAEDHDVLVYFDIKGIEVVLEGAPNITYSHFTASRTQLFDLRERGVLLMACPGCLRAAGKGLEDLAEGIYIADKDAFFDFTKGRILTLDY